MKQGEFLHSETEFCIPAVATQNGLHTLKVYLWGAVRTVKLQGVIGKTFCLPNIFPENGVFQFDLIQPDGTLFDDLSGCPMTIEVLIHSCEPNY